MRYRVLLLSVSFMGALLSGCQGPAVKLGQTKLPTSALPLACLTIGVEHEKWPLEKVVLTDLRTGNDVSFTFGGDGEPSYPTTIENNDTVLSMAIIHLEAGVYGIREVVFSPSVQGSLATFEVNLEKGTAFTFNVGPGVANYVGTIYLAPAWSGRFGPVLPTRDSTEQRFPVRARGAATQKRDRMWAGEVIPALKEVDSDNTPLVVVGNSTVEGTLKLTATLSKEMEYRNGRNALDQIRKP